MNNQTPIKLSGMMVHDPFGMITVGRSWELGSEYRYGFQNQEIENEMSDNYVVFKYRFADCRLGKFFSIDPLAKSFPWNSPYTFSENKLISMRELEGLETVDAKTGETVQGPFTNENDLNATGESKDAWSDLISFTPDEVIVHAAEHRVDDFYVQNIADAESNQLNLDYYSVTISKLPNGYSTPGDYLEHIRAQFDEYSKSESISFSTTFGPYNEIEGSTWESPGAYGNIMTFNMYFAIYPVDDGSVMLSAREVNYWIFSTVHTDLDDQHPVSGNRMFGITTNYDIAGNIVSYTFFTRGADRPSGLLDTYGSSLVFKGADMLWNDLMQNVTDDVNQNGGKAVKAISWSKRVAW